MLNLKQGENVRVAFGGSTNFTTTSAVSLFDTQNNLRPLKASERLILDNIFLVNAADVISGGYFALVSAPGGTRSSTLMDANGVLFASTLIHIFDFRAANSSTFFAFDPERLFLGEGWPCPAGILPSILNDASESGNPTYLTGLGRVVEVTVQGVQPSWKGTGS